MKNSCNKAVLSGYTLGNTVVLKLSKAPEASFKGLSYLSHIGGAEAPVKNANGIGMLIFYNMPVSDCINTSSKESISSYQSSVFPNPTTGIVQIKLSAPSTVSIYDVSGVLIYRECVNNFDAHPVRIQGPSGWYLVVIANEDLFHTFRIMKH